MNAADAATITTRRRCGGGGTEGKGSRRVATLEFAVLVPQRAQGSGSTCAALGLRRGASDKGSCAIWWLMASV
jgi:hypothetical protein